MGFAGWLTAILDRLGMLAPVNATGRIVNLAAADRSVVALPAADLSAVALSAADRSAVSLPASAEG